MKFLTQLLILILLLVLRTSAQEVKNPMFELHGVWVASVNNIDWPSAKNLSVKQQKHEFTNLVEMHRKNGMNSLFVQIRPAADAFYQSSYEPWSEFLMGKQGVAPNPFYDPLEFMIEETHKRGMEFHAWLNPYRAVFNIKSSSITANHITNLKPEWFLVYGDKKYFNPALKEVRDYFNKIVIDIVSRYNVDGIHIDDYFYPYKIAGKEFPDYKFYKASQTTLSLADWRRSNCDSIIKQLWFTINSLPKRVKFGVSPFGVWRNIEKDPNGSFTKAGQTNYDDLYANILLWLKKGWVDYCVPQLYWERGHALCDYDTLLNWWAKNSFGRQVYVGHGLYKAGTTPGYRDFNELPNEIINLRKQQNIQGSVYFSSSNFIANINGWSDSLRLNYYSTPAIIPPMAWIDSSKPNPPTITSYPEGGYSFKYSGNTKIKGIAIFTGQSKASSVCKKIIFDPKEEYNLDDYYTNSLTKIFIASLSVTNNLSDLVEVK